jgi:hypothetical protein
MSLKLVAIPTNMVDVMWDKIVPYIDIVVELSHGELESESTKLKAIDGEILLVAVCDGTDIIAVNILEVRIFESGKRAMCIPVVGGTRMAEWKYDFLKLAHQLARDFNCEELRGFAVRKGWLRELKDDGWEEVYTTVSCKVEKI